MAVTYQPSSTNNQLLVPLQGTREWSTSLFGCFTDIGSCVLSFFCMPCMICRVSSRLGECCMTPYCVPGGTVILRTRLRTAGGIQGSICNDCMVTSCFTPCAVCQMSRELDNMGVN